MSRVGQQQRKMVATGIKLSKHNAFEETIDGKYTKRKNRKFLDNKGNNKISTLGQQKGHNSRKTSPGNDATSGREDDFLFKRHLSLCRLLQIENARVSLSIVAFPWSFSTRPHNDSLRRHQSRFEQPPYPLGEVSPKLPANALGNAASDIEDS